MHTQAVYCLLFTTVLVHMLAVYCLLCTICFILFTLKCFSIGTPTTIYFPLVRNRKLIILKHIRVFSAVHYVQSNFDSSKCLRLSTFFRTIRISNLPSWLLQYYRKNPSVQNNRVFRENVKLLRME